MYENKRRPSITLVARHRRIGYDLCCLLHLSLFIIESGLWKLSVGSIRSAYIVSTLLHML